ncbi:MAG: hypothetical protein ACPF9K_06570 [Neptuniibacter sp.]
MYTDEDLEIAVKKGIFSADSVEEFRDDYLKRRNTHTADEENFRLIASFNDIFVVIAIGLLLLSLGWVTYAIDSALSGFVVAAASWALAEFFVLNRKMALPAIALLVSFVGSVFAGVVALFGLPSENSLMIAGLVASISAWLHWRRFKVPITVAAGAAALVVFVLSLIISVVPASKDFLVLMLFIGGMAVFTLAMYWDASDLQRISGKSDVAFWLHLTAAPLIVHPVFSVLGVLEGNESAVSLVSIILLYLFLTFISVVIDRRAFMVSALVYVLVALTDLLDDYGLAGDGFAYVGVLIGFSLLLLSGFWHKARLQLVMLLPGSIQSRVPAVL